MFGVVAPLSEKKSARDVGRVSPRRFRLRLWAYGGFANTSKRSFHVPRYPCIPEAMAVANDDEWDDETYARQQAVASSFS